MAADPSQTTASEQPSASTQTDGNDEPTAETDTRQYDVELVQSWETDRPSGGVIAAGGDLLLDQNGVSRYATDGTLVAETGRFPENWYSRITKGYGNAIHLDETGLYVGVNFNDDGEEQHGARMYAFDPDSGEERWLYEEPADGHHYQIAAITRVDDLLVYASQATGSGDEQRPTIRALEADSGDDQWAFGYDTDFVNQVIGHGNRLYVQQLTMLRAYDLQTRELLEEKRVGGGFEPTLLAGSDLFVPANNLRKFDAGTFQEEWATETEYEMNTKPAADESAVYLGTESGYVLAFDRENGEKRWERRVEGAVSHPPVVEDGLVWIGDERGGLSAFAAGSGERVFAADLEPDFSFDVQDGVLKDSVRKAAFEIRS